MPGRGPDRAAARSRSTATTRPTSRCSWPSRPAGRRARSPRLVAARLRERRRHRRGRRRRPGLPQHHGSTRPRRASSPARSSTAGDGVRHATTPLAGQTVNLEFVSANPTGPVHLGDVRWAAVGDALARLLEATGAEVDARVLLQRRRRADRPVRPVAARRGAGRADARGRLRRRVHRRDRRRRSSRSDPGVLDLDDDDGAGGVPARRASTLMFDGDPAVARRLRRRVRRLVLREGPARQGRARRGARAGCASRATSSSRTARSGCARPTSATTRTGCWSRATASRTYFAADCAYYLDKRERGFDRCVYMLGADHHGYVGRLQGAGRVLRRRPRREPRGPDRAAGQPVPGRRAGADEQAGRHHGHARGPGRRDRRRRRPLRAGPLLQRTRTIDLDLDLWARHTNDNPVFYVQYAHARVASLLRNAAELGIDKRRRCDPELLDARARGRPARRPRRVPAGRRDRGRAARAAPGRALPRGAGRHLPPVLRRLPGAAARRRGGRPTCTGPGSGWSRRPGSCSPTASRLLGVTAPERM